ncbi:dihydrolipoyl dehydrogenase, partial [Candidatus Aerophobetes bacterium]
MGKSEEFDIAIIGAGPGGYVAAIKAAQSNKSVALIEKDYLGGTCLNCGCIPTKTLIANAEVLQKIKKADQYGIHVENLSFDYAKMKERKDSVVTGIRNSLEGLLKSNKIKIFKGHAKFTGPKDLKIDGEDATNIRAKTIIIASGSTTLDIKAFPADHDKILNSTSILEMTELPKTLAIIGGGYIGCEFASLYAEMGVKVTILEAMDTIVAMQGKAIADFLTSSFKKQGIEIKTNVMVTGIDKNADGVTVKLKDGSSIKCDKALVSIGRRIVSDSLDIEKAGLNLTEKSTIDVDEKLQTGVPGIYAIGDVTGKAMLAHVASHQGIVAAVNATGGEAYMHYNAVPAVIFTHPEIATVGLTLEDAKKKGLNA